MINASTLNERIKRQKWGYGTSEAVRAFRALGRAWMFCEEPGIITKNSWDNLLPPKTKLDAKND